MNERTEAFLKDFFSRHPSMASMQVQIRSAIDMLLSTFRSGGKLLLCGNGGSCADCDHIAGELLKGFLLRRPVNPVLAARLKDLYGSEGSDLAGKLQQGLPAISLCTHSAAISAFANDVEPGMVYAQQVLAYGNPGDLLLGISTSGNASNVAYAMETAHGLGLKTLGLTGRDGGRLATLCDLALVVPEQETYRIQECHLALYHLLCAAVEYELFSQ